VARQLAGSPTMLTTYLIQHEAEPSEQLRRFVDRIGPTEGQTLLPNHTQREDIA